MKTIRNRVAMMTVAGLAAGAIGLGGSALTSAATGTGAPATGPAKHEQERHPEIRRALEGLREAKRALEHADHDFDGHRVAALKDVDEGIKECEEALKADKK